ncbi:MAG: hypothetical protein LBU85_04100 [Treponema sp.]|nr:hypothetical protein [Treponema sp.]
MHILALIFSFLLLLSCKTAPKTANLPPFESGVVPLDKGASAYILADVANAKPILEGISYIPLNDKNMKQMIDRTRNAAVAVFLPSSEETRRFQLVSWGSYPSGSSIAFGANKEWKKQRSASLNTIYWHSDKAQISVSLTSSRAYVLAAMTKAPHDPIPSDEGIKLPDGFGEFGKDAVLSCWLSDPGPVLKQKLNEMGVPLEIPAEQLFIRLLPQDGQKYEANIKIIFKHFGQARILTNMLFIARRNFMASSVSQTPSVSQTEKSANGASDQESAAMLSSLLYANPAVQDGNTLLLKLPPLGVDEIALLFSMFSLQCVSCLHMNTNVKNAATASRFFSR